MDTKSKSEEIIRLFKTFGGIPPKVDVLKINARLSRLLVSRYYLRQYFATVKSKSREDTEAE